MIQHSNRHTNPALEGIDDAQVSISGSLAAVQSLGWASVAVPNCLTIIEACVCVLPNLDSVPESGGALFLKHR